VQQAFIKRKGIEGSAVKKQGNLSKKPKGRKKVDGCVRHLKDFQGAGTPEDSGGEANRRGGLVQLLQKKEFK